MSATHFLPEWIKGNTESKAADFNAAYDSIYLVGADLTATLPAPKAGRSVTFKSSGQHTMTIAPNGAEEIEGAAANYVESSQLASVTLVSDGTNWYRI